MDCGSTADTGRWRPWLGLAGLIFTPLAVFGATAVVDGLWNVPLAYPEAATTPAPGPLGPPDLFILKVFVLNGL